DLGFPAFPAQRPRVSDLAAPLRVEGTLLKLDEGATVVGRDRRQACRPAQGLVADEAGRRRGGGESHHALVPVLRAVRGRRTGASALALLLHQLLEATVVD